MQFTDARIDVALLPQPLAALLNNSQIFTAQIHHRSRRARGKNHIAPPLAPDIRSSLWRQDCSPTVDFRPLHLRACTASVRVEHQGFVPMNESAFAIARAATVPCTLMTWRSILSALTLTLQTRQITSGASVRGRVFKLATLSGILGAVTSCCAGGGIRGLEQRTLSMGLVAHSGLLVRCSGALRPSFATLLCHQARDSCFFLKCSSSAEGPCSGLVDRLGKMGEAGGGGR